MLVGHAGHSKNPGKSLAYCSLPIFEDLPFLQLVVRILYKVPLLLQQIMGFPARAATSQNELPYFF